MKRVILFLLTFTVLSFVSTGIDAQTVNIKLSDGTTIQRSVNSTVTLPQATFKSSVKAVVNSSATSTGGTVTPLIGDQATLDRMRRYLNGQRPNTNKGG